MRLLYTKWLHILHENFLVEFYRAYTETVFRAVLGSSRLGAILAQGAHHAWGAFPVQYVLDIFNIR